MKKTIIVALSILLMLTAFTACNPDNDGETESLSTAEWQIFNDGPNKKGSYISIESVPVAIDGEYDLEIAFADGTYTFIVDGQTLAKDIAPEATETAGKIQGLYFGLQANGVAPYSATFTAPVVTADGKSVDNVPALENNTNLSATEGWVNSRDGKAGVEIAADKKSVTITTTKDSEASGKYQGLELRADNLMEDAAASWSVKTTVKVDTSIFNTAGSSVGFWVEAADGTSDGFWHVIRLNSTATAAN